MRTSMIYFLAVCTTLLLVGTWYYTNVATHEHIHQSIYEDYGINSSIKYNFNPFSDKGWIGVTIPDSNSNYGLCSDSCRLANEMNEVVGYNFAILISVILVMFIIYLSVNTIEYSELELQEVMQC